jgi:hypothetical protein
MWHFKYVLFTYIPIPTYILPFTALFKGALKIEFSKRSMKVTYCFLIPLLIVAVRLLPLPGMFFQVLLLFLQKTLASTY